MAVTHASRLLSPEEIAVQAGQQVPYVLLPAAQVFAERATRLRQLAAGHAMRDFLLFAAELAQAQQAVLDTAPLLALPSAAQIDTAASAGLPTLQATTWPRDPAWRGLLHRLLDQLAPRLASRPENAQVLATLQALRTLDADALERQADRLLHGITAGLDLAAAPLVAAGLQLCFTRLVQATEAARGADRLPPFGRTDDPSHCPCCGSLPTASISRLGPQEGHRYLHCALCSSQWHLVRIKCSHCLGTKGISFQGLEAAAGVALPTTGARPGAVQAELCEPCGHYLKIVHMAKDNQVEPMADDLASLTLDLLLADAGHQRHGLNLWLLFGDDGAGDPDAPPQAPPPDPGPP